MTTNAEGSLQRRQSTTIPRANTVYEEEGSGGRRFKNLHIHRLVHSSLFKYSINLFHICMFRMIFCDMVVLMRKYFIFRCIGVGRRKRLEGCPNCVVSVWVCVYVHVYVCIRTSTTSLLPATLAHSNSRLCFTVPIFT